MPILYSAVAHKENILACFASCEGNFTEIAQEVISKIPTINGKMTYYHGPYLIHYIMENRHLYFCITNKLCQRSRAFLFLNEIHRRFLTQGKDNFTEVLAKQMYTYSEDYSTITVRKGELDELNTIGVESSETILGEKVLFVNNPENITYAENYNGNNPLFSFGDIVAEKLCLAEVAKLPYIDDFVTVSYVGKSPGNMSVTMKNSTPKLYVGVIGVFILLIGATYVISPMSCAVIVGLIGGSFVKRMGMHNKESGPS